MGYNYLLKLFDSNRFIFADLTQCDQSYYARKTTAKTTSTTRRTAIKNNNDNKMKMPELEESF